MPARLEFNPAFYKKLGASFALWKPPGTIRYCIFGKGTKVFEPEMINTKQEGFVFVPFENLPETKPLLIMGNVFENPDTSSETRYTDYYLNKEDILLESRDNFVANVAGAVDTINRGYLQKVVLARNESWPVPKDFCPLAYFNRLCEAYPESFVSLVSIPDVGTWIGATPEYLLKITADYLMTVGLAGTQPAGDPHWTEKESEEQLWVVRYIEDVLKKLNITEIEIARRKIIKNGPLEHLYTEIKFSKNRTKTTEIAARILHYLHPTPAVCGLPKEKAAGFIGMHEKFYRNYYTGVLGPMNINDESHFFVNLRCMQLTPDGFIAYAGAGITKDSIPEKELEETERKMNNLKKWL